MTDSSKDTEIIDIYQFGAYVLEPAQRELRKEGKPVEIEPRAFDVLVYLARHHDHAVNKDELQDAVWPGMVVTETALTRAVMKARKAVGDDAGTQAVIKTLHGHGYRFVASLEIGQAETQDQAEPLAPAVNAVTGREKSPASSAWNLRFTWLVAIVLLIALSWYILNSQSSPETESRIAVLPLIDTTEKPDLSWSSLGLMSYVSKSIETDGSLAVVPEANVVSLSSNLGWDGDRNDSRSKNLFSKLRQAYGASHILIMELKKEGRSLRMNYSLAGPDGHWQEGTIVGDQPTELAQGVVQVVYGTLLQRSRLGPDSILVSKDPFNNEAFSRGMDLVLSGRCSDAVQFFRVIIEQEPKLFTPRYEYAACLRILGATEEAESLLSNLIDEARMMDSSGQLAQTQLTLGILYHRTGRLDEAQKKYEEALAISEQTGNRELSGRILLNLSIVYKDHSELDEAERLLDLAALAYQEAGREILPGQLYSGRANIKMARGELAEAEGYLAQALAAFREIGDRRNEAMMLNNTGYLKRRQGKHDEGEEYHLRSLAIREEIGDRMGVGRIYGLLGGLYTERGQYDDAVKALTLSLEIARETHDRLFESTSLVQLADAEQALGQLEIARQHYLEGHTIFVEIEDASRTLLTELRLARLDLAEKAPDQAWTIALRVLEHSREQSLLEPELQALELLGDIEITRGNTANAITEFSSALTRVREATLISMENKLVSKLANAYMDQSDLEATAPLIGALTGQEPNIQSLMTQARFAFLRGNAKTAIELMSDARERSGKYWSAESEELLKKYRDQDSSDF